MEDPFCECCNDTRSRYTLMAHDDKGCKIFEESFVCCVKCLLECKNCFGMPYTDRTSYDRRNSGEKHGKN